VLCLPTLHSWSVLSIAHRISHLSLCPFYAELEVIVSGVASNSDVVLMGDFNLDPVAFASNFQRFESMLASFGLSILDSPPTRVTETSSTTLGRVALKDTSKLKCLSVHPVSAVTDHDLVVFNLDHARSIEKPVVGYYRDFKLLSVNALENEFRMQDWTLVSLAADTERKVSNLQSILKYYLDRYAPLKMMTFMPCNVGAEDAELRRLVEMRKCVQSLEIEKKDAAWRSALAGV
jgi:hypothetical protein